ncbi:PREDICTED: uncharacterized protein LOC100639407 [Amphimedon queenslandica]|uniref:Uncharacterized protein n=1 Tax=Amphimedon queenslandica TaxID=400682 RepID=A0A1X7UVD5_AMPQE|nr:PREDICTED: uncharacterized protein LOC100639407 [Amphimedon queenslandica]|eukprot:XP_019852266.1 PREDICTED: uncharacterized protein LOC100639407 [Amphimedon queenslandica]
MFGGSCVFAPTPFLPLISLLILLSNARIVAAQTLSNVEAIFIITAIFLIFMICNFVLLVALFAWCRQERKKRRREWARSRIRQRSQECLDEPRLKKVSVIPEEVEEDNLDEVKVSVETSFQEVEEKRRISNEYVTVDTVSSSPSLEMSPERGSAIGEELHYESSKSFESRRKESQGKRSEQRRESEKLLLEGDPEDSFKPMSLLPSFDAVDAPKEDHEHDEISDDIPSFNKKRAPVARQQSSDYRRDAHASLVENEIIVEALSPTPTLELETPQGNVPNGSQTDTTQILAETSFSATEPAQHLSIDHSHSEGTADFNTSSATSIGRSSVSKILSGVESDVNGLHQNKEGGGQQNKERGGKLAQEGLFELLDGSYGKKESLNYSLTGSMDDTAITPNSSFASASYSGVSPGAAFNSSLIEANHGRAQSFDRTTTTSKYSPSTFYTPQHAIPRPRGSDPTKYSSISLTSSPAHTKRKDTK